MARFLSYILGVLILALSVQAEQPTGSHPRTLRVGAVLGLTGPAAIHGTAVQRGLELAKEDLVRAGWQVELEYQDDQTQSAKTVMGLQSLIARGVTLFVGPTWDFQIIAAHPIFQARKAITLAATASSEVGGGSSTGIFFMVPPRAGLLKPLQDFLKSRALSRAVLLMPNGSWGEVHQELFKEAVKGAGGSVASAEFFDYGVSVSQLSTTLNRLRERNPDVVLVTGAGLDIASLIKARNQLQLKFTIVATDTARDILKDKLLNPDELKQVYVAEIAPQPRFIERYLEKFGATPGNYSDSAYDSLMILAEATSKTDGSLEQIQSYLQNRCDYDGMSGRKRFDSKGDVKDGESRVVALE
jgi:branched-chain amino acid transport system substrate-binding protein